MKVSTSSPESPPARVLTPIRDSTNAPKRPLSRFPVSSSPVPDSEDDNPVSDDDHAVLPIFNPNISYIVRDPDLFPFGLLFHSYFKTVHCVNAQCKVAVLPSEIADHFATEHSLCLEASELKAIKSACTKLGARKDKDIRMPPLGKGTVECLHLQTIVQCGECGATFYNNKKFRRHFHKAHAGCADDNQKLLTVQQFFSSPAICFRIDPAFSPPPDPDFLSIFMRTRAPLIARASAPTPQAAEPHILDPFLSATSWNIQLADYIKSAHLRRRLHQLLPPPDSTDPGLLGPRTLGLVVTRYLKHIVRLTDKAPLGVRCLLMGYPRYILQSQHLQITPLTLPLF